MRIPSELDGQSVCYAPRGWIASALVLRPDPTEVGVVQKGE
jgi:hypothetical protein